MPARVNILREREGIKQKAKIVDGHDRALKHIATAIERTLSVWIIRMGRSARQLSNSDIPAEYN